MRILGLDLETSGLDPIKNYITEIGAVLWDTATQKPIYIFNEYLKTRGTFEPVSKEITQLTGITNDHLLEFGVEPTYALNLLRELSKKAEYVVAHNGTLFDKPFLDTAMDKMNLAKVTKPWIDTKIDVPYPDSITTRKLTFLATEHGFVNPFAHRAILDVLTMLKVLSHYDIDEVAATSKVPTINIRAMVSFEDKDKAKERNYYWDGDKRIWFKAIKENLLTKEMEDADFKVVVITDASNTK